MRTIVIAQPTKRKSDSPSPAWRLYQGSQQRLLQDGLQAVWDRYGHREVVDELILSPLHGPLPADQVVAPYDFTWKGRAKAEVERVVREGQMIERLQELVAGYELVVVLLSRVYLAPLRLNDWVPGAAPQRWLFVASGEGLPFLPEGPGVRWITAGVPEARRERVKVLDLKSHLFLGICRRIVDEGPSALERAWDEAERLG